MDFSAEPRFVEANGIRLAFFEGGRGPLAVMLHGFPDTPHTWKHIAPAVEAAGFRVVAPYLRGYPPSGFAPDGVYSSIATGRDVLSLIEALGEKEAIVIGHDWGAFAAYSAASQDSSRVKKLVTLAIPHPGALAFTFRALYKARHFVELQFRTRAIRRLSRDGFSGIDEIYRRWSPGWSVPEGELAEIKKSLAAPGGMEGALGYYWTFRREVSQRSVREVMQKKTRVPSLSFFGDDDGALDLSTVDKTREHFTGPYELVRLAGAGHFLHREKSDAVLAKLLPFLTAP